MEILSSFATLPPPSMTKLNCAEELYLKIDSPPQIFLLPHIRYTWECCGEAADATDLKAFLLSRNYTTLYLLDFSPYCCGVQAKCPLPASLFPAGVLTES